MLELDSKSNTVKPLKGFYRFFCWCSGARLYLLKKCPTDYNTFMGIGIIVMLTGIMAFFSGSYAFYTVFQNPYMAIGFGLFWGILIFFLDWYLVASLKKENKVLREILTASPRIILALFLAVVISRPLELKLFEPEIEAQMHKLNRLKYNDYKSVVDNSYQEIDNIQKQNQEYQAYLADLQVRRSRMFELFIAEAEGTGGTGIVGKGSVYREKKKEYDDISKMLEQEKERIYPIIEANNQQLAILSENKNAQLNKGDQVMESATGFLARMEAYNSLAKENTSIKLAGWFIMLLFICIEAGPMFVKLISKRGAYDELLALEEERKMKTWEEEHVKLQERTYRKMEIEKHKSQLMLDEELSNNETYTKMLAEAQVEIAKAKVQRWKERELNMLDANFEDYRPTIDELIEDAKITIKPN